MSDSLLELSGISKSYPGVMALEDVGLRLGQGEVLGLIGENGAGKSTLMKILGGVVSPSAGTILIDDRTFAALTVADAHRVGIGFVHQELNLFENLDVAANVFIGREPRVGGILNLIQRHRLYEMTAPLLQRIGADFSPDTRVASLSIAQRQLVEIAKALSLSARIIIMDEPTSSLSLTETDRLLQVISELKQDGVSIIYVSHRLQELKTCADRVVCLRDGRLVGELAHDQIEHAAMIHLMIGRDLKSLYIPPKAPPHDNGCVITDVVIAAFPNRKVSLNLRQGEILGLAGLIGAGRTSLARSLFGIDRILSGTVHLNGVSLDIRSPRQAIAHGIYLVPEDRKRDGLVLTMPLVENVTLASLSGFTRMLLVDHDAELQVSHRQREALSIRAPGDETLVVSLSGGNQQKVVLAKFLSMQPRMMIFDEPTRGIDVGTKREIYTLIRALADSGVIILMISSDMEEIIGVSDRIAVMHEGTIAGVIGRPNFSEYNVLRLAIGEIPPIIGQH